MRFDLRTTWQERDRRERRAAWLVAAYFVGMLALGFYGGLACGDLCGCRTWCGLAVEALR